MQIARHQISFLQDLNEKQFEAVTLDSGSALVLAGAGSVKHGFSLLVSPGLFIIKLLVQAVF